MNMVFCRSCGEKISDTVTMCLKCNALQNNNPSQGSDATENSNDAKSISDSWKKKFDLMEKAGGVKMQRIKELSFNEKNQVLFNVWGFLFGPIYYLAKGMWKKGISLTIASILAITIVEVICQKFGFSDFITNFIAGAIFATRANIDYYKKIKLGDNEWW